MWNLLAYLLSPLITKLRRATGAIQDPPPRKVGPKQARALFEQAERRRKRERWRKHDDR